MTCPGASGQRARRASHRDRRRWAQRSACTASAAIGVTVSTPRTSLGRYHPLAPPASSESDENRALRGYLNRPKRRLWTTQRSVVSEPLLVAGKIPAATMAIIDLQRRQPGPRADKLLAGLQAALATEERVRWNASGHARLRVSQELEEARITVATRLAELGQDWVDHIAIL